MGRILARLRKKLYDTLAEVPTIRSIAIIAPSADPLMVKAIARVFVQPSYVGL
jgi:hypothetical protein